MGRRKVLSSQHFGEGVCLGVPLLDFVLCLAEVTDFVSPSLLEHHLKVGYLAFRLGEALGLSEESCKTLLLGGLLHDIGAFSLQERLHALRFEFNNPDYHAFVAYVLLKDFPPFSTLAEVVRFHHVPWEEGKGKERRGVPVPLESHILHFADRVSIVCAFNEDPVGVVQEKVGFFENFVPRLFHPEVFRAFQSLLHKEYIWLDLASSHLRRLVGQLIPPEELCLGVEDFLAFAELVSHLIDFRSPFTATHSAGVAHVAYCLGDLTGLPKSREHLLFTAGFLHDLGKMAVPLEILEKPGPLTEREMRIMKSHAYYTFTALSWAQHMKDVALWAAEHHERCNGKGYPFGRTEDELLFESRVMAVADVFTALAEDRPYRKALSPSRIREVLGDMASSRGLDKGIVEVLFDHFAEVYEFCKDAQSKAASAYANFRRDLSHFA
ncbi:MAG: HD domain-containing protein [Candidatus Caldatribacterium sp.]|nr:HD domain-containing protein [Candidatus Caldatribacterium sp.]